MTDQEIARALESMIREDAKRPPEEQIRDLLEAGVIDEKGRVLLGFGNKTKQEYKAEAKTAPLLKLGDRVRVLYYPDLRGRIVELCGPLGPGGAQIYRVRFPRKPKSMYIELREDQLIPIPPET